MGKVSHAHQELLVAAQISPRSKVADNPIPASEQLTKPPLTTQSLPKSTSEYVLTRSGAKIWKGPRPGKSKDRSVQTKKSPGDLPVIHGGPHQSLVQTEISPRSQSHPQPGSPKPVQTGTGAPTDQTPVQTETSPTTQPRSDPQPGPSRSPTPVQTESESTRDTDAEESPVMDEQEVTDQSTPEWSGDQGEDGQSGGGHFYVSVDDGSKRCFRRRPLRECPEAVAACGQELDESASQDPSGSKKRKRNKGKGDIRCGRGLAKRRDPAPPEKRPILIPVGQGEFTSSPMCTKVITTIRLLTLENLPGPFRSYNMFPTKVRLVILQQFMQRYSWGPNENIGHCLDVFENIAAEAYQRELTETRAALTLKRSEDKKVWKDYPPAWCKNLEAWKGLVDIWSTPKWGHISAKNRENRTKIPSMVYHVTGSRSSYRHKQALIAEKGSSVGLLDVFERTHTKQFPHGKVYVNTRAQEKAESFRKLKAAEGDKKEEQELWEEVVKGEDKRGRLYGFGNKSRTSKATRVLETVEASVEHPTKSTATSAAEHPKRYTADEVASLLAADRKDFAASLDAQEKRHQDELDEMKRQNKYIRDCFVVFFASQNMKPPPFNPSCGAGMTSWGHNEGEEMAQPSTTNSGGGENRQPGRGHNEGEKSAQPSTTNSGGGDNPQPTNSAVF